MQRGSRVAELDRFQWGGVSKSTTGQLSLTGSVDDSSSGTKQIRIASIFLPSELFIHSHRPLCAGIKSHTSQTFSMRFEVSEKQRTVCGMCRRGYNV